MKHHFYRNVLSAALISACILAPSQVMAEEQTNNTNITAIYADMQTRTAAKPDNNLPPCVAAACEENQRFDQRVADLGETLAVAAYDLHPELQDRVKYFQFSVANKAEIGAASSKNGEVVLLRGLQDLALSDEALSFIIAREMGHVIANHHRKNIKTKLFISALTSVLFPAIGVISASNTVSQARIATSAASSVTSLVGSEVAMLNVKPKQLIEADNIAVKLMANQGVSQYVLLDQLALKETNTNWLKDLQKTQAHLAATDEGQTVVVTYAYPNI